MGLLSLARKKCVQQRSEWWASLVSPSLLLCLLRTLQGWRNVWIAPLHCRCNQEAEISFSSKWSHKYRYEINFQETFRFHKNVPITVWNKHIPAYQHMNLFFFFHHYKITTSVSCFNIYRILHNPGLEYSFESVYGQDVLQLQHSLQILTLNLTAVLCFLIGLSSLSCDGYNGWDSLLNWAELSWKQWKLCMFCKVSFV